MSQEQGRETFQAVAPHTGTRPSGQTTIQINVNRLTSQEEHDQFVGVIMNVSSTVSFDTVESPSRLPDMPMNMAW